MRYLLFVLLLLASFALSAQTISRQVIGTTGGSATAGSLQVSSTAGEAVTQTVTAGTLILTQGFQQPDAKRSTSIEVPVVKVGYEVYPNPTQDVWNINLETETPRVLDIRLIDMQGRALPGYSARLNLQNSLTRTWDVSQLAAGTYMLQITALEGNYQAHLKLQKVN